MALWGKTTANEDKPKYLSPADAEITHGYTKTDVAIANNRAKGIKTPGWVKVFEYVDSSGATRYQTELIASVPSMVEAALKITIGTQPASTSVVAPATATFTVVATSTGADTLTYQWQVSTGGLFSDIKDATSASYTTGVTAVGDTGTKYQVVISAPDVESVTSTAATLTVTAS